MVNNLRFVLLFIIANILVSDSKAQVVGNDIFIKGKYVELAVGQYGYYGSGSTPPTGYHPKSSILGFVADPDKDGWTVGSPAYYGDYFVPGIPYEGWHMRFDSVNYNSVNGYDIFYSAINVVKRIQYTLGSTVYSIWEAEIDNKIRLTQTTILDTTNLYFVVNMKAQNISSSKIKNVYYGRTVDPDNESNITSLPATKNDIVFQNDAEKNLVSAVGTTYEKAYLGLGTIDSRAKVYINGTWDIHNLSSIFSSPSTLGIDETKGASHTGDLTIGLAFQLGDLDTNECKTFAYTYILNEAYLDSALEKTKPVLLVDGKTFKISDTILTCALDSVTVSITSGDSLIWGDMYPNTGVRKVDNSTYKIATNNTTPIEYKTYGASADFCKNDSFVFTLPVINYAEINGKDSSVQYCLNATPVDIFAATTKTVSDTLVYYTGSSEVYSTTKPTINTDTGGTYLFYAQARPLFGCPSQKIEYKVLVDDNVISGPDSLCLAETIIYSSSMGSDSLNPWSSSNTSVLVIDKNGLVKALSPGTATITHKGRSGCDATKTIKVNPYSILLDPIDEVCLNESITLIGSATAHKSKPWETSDKKMATIDKKGQLTALKVGAVDVIYQNIHGCKVTHSVTINELPEITGNHEICIDATYEFKANHDGDAEMPWTIKDTAIASVTEKGEVTGKKEGTTFVLFKNDKGCNIEFEINVKPLPVLSVISDKLCVHDSAIIETVFTPIDVTPWISSNESIATISDSGMVVGVSRGDVTFTFTDQFGCQSALDMTIQQSYQPDIKDQLSVCQYQVFEWPSFETKIMWYESDTSVVGTTDVPAVYTNDPDVFTYFLTATDSTNCESEKLQVEITVNELPKQPEVVSPIMYCHEDNSKELTAEGTLLKWYETITSTEALEGAPSPSTETAPNSEYFYVTQTDETTGCESFKSEINVITNENPIIEITTSLSNGMWICKGRNLPLQVNSSTSIQQTKWYLDGTIAPAHNADTAFVTKPGSWSVQVTDLNGCKGNDTIVANKDANPIPVLTPNKKTICIDQNEPLTVNPGLTHYKFDWYKDNTIIHTSEGFNVYNVNEEGDYYVHVTNETGCVDTTNHTIINVYPAIVKPIIENNDPILSVESIYSTYQWYKNEGIESGSRSNIYNVKSEGTYFVKVYDKNGCSANSDTIFIEPKPVVSIPEVATQQASIKIYPNPTNGILNIESNETVLVAVYDMNGRQVIGLNATSKVDISTLANGTYFIHVYNQNNQILGIKQIAKIAQ
jgi:hypothetical protein